MQTRATVSTLTLSLALASTVASAPSLAQYARRTGQRRAAQACVQFTSQDGAGGRSMEFELNNQCTVAVEGVVSWRVACEGESQGAVQEHRESLEPGQRHVFTASAEACGARSFSIDDVHWSWRQIHES